MGGGAHGGPEAVALLPVAGLPGFWGDPPEWSYQQVKGSSDASNDDRSRANHRRARSGSKRVPTS